MKKKLLLLTTLVSVVVAGITAAVAMAWGGVSVTLVSCGEVDISFTQSENGPWWYSINQDSQNGPVLYTNTTDGTVHNLSVGVRALDNNEHTIYVSVANAANHNDGLVVDHNVRFVNCGPLTGTPGPKGDTGATGPAGPQGPAGPKGDNGLPGPAGPQGPAGPAGAKGADGAAGSVGPVGPIGPKGSKGDKGVRGSQGKPGPVKVIHDRPVLPPTTT